MSDITAMTQAERESLLGYVQNMSEDQWATMTVCDPWTVRHLVAHLTALGNQTAPNFFTGLIRSGFSFDKFVARDLEKYNQGSTDDLLQRFTASIEDPKTPPGPKYVALGEFMMHGEDIRRALGDRGEHDPSHVAALGELYAKTGGPIGGKKRITGLRLRATDGDWTLGDGPEVAGPGIDLIRAMTGRTEALDHCEGDGVATLRSRS